MVKEDEVFIIDSIPIPVCKIVRERSSRVCRREEFDEVTANKGFNLALGGYYIGYKMHIITTSSGVYRDMLLTPGIAHDSIFLKLLNKEDDHLRSRELLGDCGYIGKAIQLQLFEELELKLNISYRRIQHDYKKYNIEMKVKRKTIKVIFSQYCDEYSIRNNYVKRFGSFDIRMVSKIAAKTFKQYWNYLHGKPINQTKHSLAA